LEDLRAFWWPPPRGLRGVSQWPGLPPEQFPETFEEMRNSLETPSQAGEELPPDIASELPPDEAAEKEPERKSIAERFCSGELIPVGEIIAFPNGLPALLRVA
jgi:hypothetical protein